VKVIKEGEGTEEERPREALMLLKYDGVLTHVGRKQAEELGRSFRNYMYPREGPGLLRLHSTYQHDFKIYSSDEGRVQVSTMSSHHKQPPSAEARQGMQNAVKSHNLH